MLRMLTGSHSITDSLTHTLTRMYRHTPTHYFMGHFLDAPINVMVLKIQPR